MKYHQNRLVRSRDINVLVLTGSRFFKPEVDTKKHKSDIFLESDSLGDYKKRFFFFLNRTKIEKYCKNMHILQIWSAILNF